MPNIRCSEATAQRIVDHVSANPAAQPETVAKAVGISESTASGAMSYLVKTRKLEKVWLQRQVRYFAVGVHRGPVCSDDFALKVITEAGTAGVDGVKGRGLAGLSKQAWRKATVRLRAKNLIFAQMLRAGVGCLWYAAGVTPDKIIIPKAAKPAREAVQLTPRKSVKAADLKKLPKAERITAHRQSIVIPPRSAQLSGIKPIKRMAAEPLSPAAKFAQREAIVPEGVKVQVCPPWTHDTRYQLPPGSKVVGGFATMGMGRYLEAAA